MLLALSSENIPPAQIYDAADSILAQKLAQVEGVGQVFTWGSSRPAVRVEVNPYQLTATESAFETVRKIAPVRERESRQRYPLGSQQNWTVTDTDQLFKAYEYQPLIVAGHVGAPVPLARRCGSPRFRRGHS